MVQNKTISLYHHHIGLNTWFSKGSSPAPGGHTGLFHAAFLYPDRTALARAVAQVMAADVRIEGASDHGVSEAVYLSDPDGNGIELYHDRAPGDWPRQTDDTLTMTPKALDLQDLLAGIERSPAET
ncbi:hypothetical protein E2K80_01825 [Rhodophyticola sp. CCM32]|nr:VOC family protein [Rhodophyticola sp. CCM32]QBX99614.1 hypothetical protein E2K80_01825 [Rhodophyticola sp. CCM32]